MRYHDNVDGYFDTHEVRFQHVHGGSHSLSGTLAAPEPLHALCQKFTVSGDQSPADAVSDSHVEGHPLDKHVAELRNTPKPVSSLNLTLHATTLHTLQLRFPRPGDVSVLFLQQRLQPSLVAC